MVSPRLDGLVRDPTQRTYLDGDDGYWADLVLDQLAFLEERGFALEGPRFHQAGDYIYYGNAGSHVLFEFFPDGGAIVGSASLRSDGASFEGDLGLLAALEKPGVAPPPTYPLTQETIRLNVTFWARLLRSVESRLL